MSEFYSFANHAANFDPSNINTTFVTAEKSTLKFVDVVNSGKIRPGYEDVFMNKDNILIPAI